MGHVSLRKINFRKIVFFLSLILILIDVVKKDFVQLLNHILEELMVLF